ncbi:MAG: hypothetical protein SFU25_12055 [Candidatus Caenarcaniphilales bacterium]|nr:hypothetical protein [Candidatus Caenarcaniphilales bacterium]
MKIYLPKKYKNLPQWIKNMAALDAVGYVEEILNLRRSDKKYREEIESRMNHFLDEAMRESLTANVGGD